MPGIHATGSGEKLGKKARKRKESIPARPAAKQGRDWPRLIGEATIIALIPIVSIVINPRSKNLLDVKDFALGVLVALGLALWLVASLGRGRMEWASSRLNLFVAAFPLWAGVTLVYSGYRFATVPELARLAAHLGLYWLVVLAIRDMGQVRRLIGAMAVAAAPVVVYGVMQAAGRDPIKWTAPAIRVFSFLGNATYLAGFLVLIIPLVVAAGWPERKGEGGRARPWSWALLAVAAAMVVCLYLTITLSPMIGLGAAVVVVAGPLALIRAKARELRAAIPSIAVGLVVLGVLGVIGYRRLPAPEQQRVQQVARFQDPFAAERQLHWKTGLELFRDTPVFGRGYGTYKVYSLERMAPAWYLDLGDRTQTMLVPGYAHNEYIAVLAETGVIGGALFLALVVTVYVSALRVALREKDRDWGRLGVGVAVGVTAFLFQNVFGVTFRQPGTVTFFWLALGLLGVAAARTPGAEGEGAPRVRQVAFRRASAPALVAVSGGLAVVVLALGWASVKPVMAGMLLKQAERAAKAGQFKTAARLGDESIRYDPYSPVARYILAYAYGRLGEYDKALEANERALALLPGNAGVYYNLGVTYKKMGQLKEAEGSFRRAIELMPTSTQQQAAMAEVLLHQGRVKEAAPYAQEALRLSPRDPRCYLLMADVEARRGNIAKTVEYMQGAAAIAPDDMDVRRQTARLLARMKRYKEAIDASGEWLRLEPGASGAYDLRGTCQYNLGMFREAKESFEQALVRDPGNVRVRLRLFYSLAQLGERERASQELREIVARAPGSPEARIAGKFLKGAKR